MSDSNNTLNETKIGNGDEQLGTSTLPKNEDVGLESLGKGSPSTVPGNIENRISSDYNQNHKSEHELGDSLSPDGQAPNQHYQDADSNTLDPIMDEDQGPDSNQPRTSEKRVKFRLDRRTALILADLMLLALICSIDATSISVALPQMSGELNGTTIETVWVGSSFLLTSAVVQPLLASLSEIFGRKPIVLFSVILFAIGAVVAGTAHSFTVIIVGRSIQGVGGGGILAMNQVVITDLIPLRERGLYMSLLGGMWSVGTVIGPLLGGAFTSHATWRWIFYVNLPFCGIALVTIPFVMKLHLETSSLRQKLARIDYIGTVIFTCSCTSLLLGIIFGGVTFPWKSWHVIVPIVVGGVGLLGFGYYEKMYAKEPMVRLEVFESTIAKTGYVQTALHGMALWCLVYYLPLYYQGVKGYSAMGAGLAGLPESISIGPAAVGTGVCITIFGKYLWSSWSGWAISSLGAGILTLLSADSSLGRNIGLNIPVSIGTGMLFATLNMIVLTPNAGENASFAAAMLSFVRVMGQAFGVAIGGSVFANQLTSQLNKDPELAKGALAYSSEAMGMIQYIQKLPDGPARDFFRVAFAESLRIVWYCILAFCLAGFVLNVFVKDMNMNVVFTAKQHVIKDEKDKENDTEQDREKGSDIV